LEAETVRMIFARYLELGSVQALAQDLERNGIRTRQRRLANGRVIGGGTFGVGGLAYLLRNRFYVGDVVYRGETFRGDHETILDSALFAAVQEKLSVQAVERRCRALGSPALLAGRLFDEHGHRMTPTHTNKKGVRYRYYVSQAVLRQRPAGPITRVPAPELEATVVGALLRHLQESGTEPVAETDRELVERHLLRMTLSTKELTLHLREEVADRDPATATPDTMVAATSTLQTLTVPWTVPATAKCIIHVPAHNTPMKPGSRETLLVAIAKARRWVKEGAQGQSFADIARRDGKAERHVRRLVPLAFVSPRIITAVINGTAPAGFSVTALAGTLPYSWAEQETRRSVPQPADSAVRSGK
jgi:site-specific DNA recombinase